MNLSQLILDKKGSRSYAQLAKDCGGRPTDKRLQQLATTGVKEFPDPDTIRAVARGLKVSENAVVLATAESLGLDVRGRGMLVEHMPSAAERLSNETAKHLLALVHSIVPTIEEAGEGHDGPASTSNAPEGPDNVRQFPAAAMATEEPALNQQRADQQDADAEQPDSEGPEGGA